jgi:GNAT superfamily N-acetyltransferase
MIRRLAPDDDSAFAALLTIYRASIEASEQKPADELRRLLQDPRYLCLTAEEQSGVAGFALVFIPAGRQFWLLEYMATDAGRRSKGIGRRLFLSAAEAAAAITPGPGLLEVDRPGAIVSLGNDIPRRLAFYQRLGCRRVDGVSYILPLDHAGTPPPMQLLIYVDPPPLTVPRETVTNWLRTLYTDVYGQPADDSRIVGMVEGLPENLRLSSDLLA